MKKTVSVKDIVQPVLFTVGIYVLWEVLGYLSAFLLSAAGAPALSETLVGNYLYMLLSELIVLLPFALICRKKIAKKDKACALNGRQFGLLLLPPMLQVGNDFSMLLGGTIQLDLLSTEGIGFLLMCLLACMTVGLLEETVWRRVIFRELLSRWGTKRGILCAVFVSATLFGLCHYMNLLTGGQTFAETSVQVLSAFCMGVFLAGIYLRTGYFFLPVLIHGVCNFSNFFMNEMLGWDYKLWKWDSAAQVVISCLYLLDGLYAVLHSRWYQES